MLKSKRYSHLLMMESQQAIVLFLSHAEMYFYKDHLTSVSLLQVSWHTRTFCHTSVLYYCVETIANILFRILLQSLVWKENRPKALGLSHVLIWYTIIFFSKITLGEASLVWSLTPNWKATVKWSDASPLCAELKTTETDTCLCQPTRC